MKLSDDLARNVDVKHQPRRSFDRYAETLQKKKDVIYLLILMLLLVLSLDIEGLKAILFLSFLVWLPSIVRSSPTASKYALRVIKNCNCLEVSIFVLQIWRALAFMAPCHRSEEQVWRPRTVEFDAAAVTARSADVRIIEWKGLIELPSTVASNAGDRDNLTVSDLEALVVWHRPTVHEEHDVVNYDD